MILKVGKGSSERLERTSAETDHFDRRSRLGRKATLCPQSFSAQVGFHEIL